MAIPTSSSVRVRLTLWTIIVVTGFSLSACDPTPTTSPPVIVTPTLGSESPNIVQLQLSDMPSGWRVGGEKSENSIDVNKIYVWFYGTPDPEQSWIGVSESIDIYPQREQAIQAYEDLLLRSFPPKAADSWKSLSELDFEYRADEWKVACLPAKIEGFSSWGCKAVARYGNAVVRILGNVFDEQWMTLDNFRSVLNAADKKMATYLQ